MRLKQLELYGFKTFADATTLVFDPGITAVVGPNGSGKSNCADALLWVLAERRLSALRASDGSDVIFAGSAHRRPLGYAEVTLTVDNSDHTLPIDLPEISVSRRVHRNGDTDYLINGRRCRRKDVVDLFLDTGVGRDAFSVISQREVDAMLSIDPSERRRLLEEVAGIERYRSRRDEALRRLQDTDTNLARVADLVAALETHLGPLAAQSEQARQYMALRDQAERLKLSLLVKDYTLSERRVLRCDEELAELDRAIAAAETALAQAEAAEEQARLDRLRADEQLSDAHDSLGRTARELEQQETRLRVGEERLQHLAERIEQLREALARSRAAGAERAAEAERLAAETERVTAELAAERAALAEREAELRSRWEEEERAEHALAEARRGLAATEQRLSALESARRAAAAALESAVGRRATLAARREQLVADADEAQRRATAATAAVAAAQQTVGERVDAQRAVEDRLAALRRREAALREQVGLARAELAERATRLEVLQSAAESYEGLFAGVKAVLQARDRGRLRGDYHVVADLLRVADGCDLAIESALGPRLQDLVCETGEDAHDAIEYLKQERAGRATFLPLDLLRQEPPLPDAERIRAMPGVVGLALDLVSCSAEFDLVRRHLLSRLVVTEDLPAALRVRRAGHDRITLVTLEGDLLRPNGSVTGGSADRKGAPLLGRRREIDQLRREHEDLDTRLAVLAEDGRALAAEITATEAELQAAQEALEAARRALADAERERLERQAEAGRLQGDLERAGELAQELETAEEAARRELEQAVAGIGAGESERAAHAEAVSRAERARHELRSGRAEEDREITTRRVAAARLESRLEALAEAVARLERDARVAAAEQERLAREVEVNERLHRESHSELRALREAWEERRAAREEWLETVEALRAMRQDADSAVEAAVAAARTARATLADAREQRHRAELRRTQADTELAGLRQMLAEDHGGLTIDQARARTDEILNRAEAADRLTSLREQMAAMGEVNLGAIDEYERISQQLLFYERQRADLREAKDDLLVVIDEIDRISAERLAEAFDAVDREFRELFDRVFGEGGEAGLHWTDPEHILDSGIEVFVRLPGKRSQSIQLLSGGERAMTTITLLLAMFRVKPSPFCLLDELDAPLDEANIRKYRALLREFADSSQFIVITHNPETARVADTLYGITMEEPGVSRAYSYRPPAEPEVDRNDLAAAD